MPDINTLENAQELTGQEKLAGVVAEYMIREWTPNQVAEFAIKLLGTYPKGEVIESFRIYLMRFCTRDEQVNFCLHMLGDEAQAWWERRKVHQS